MADFRTERDSLGEIEVPLEKLEASDDAPGNGPVRLAARFELEGAGVDVLDVDRSGAETARS